MSDDLLTPTRETSYFWGWVAGGGELTDDAVAVRTQDEQAANALGTIGGVVETDNEVVAHESAHDASIVRYAEEYELRIPVADPPAFDGEWVERFTAHRPQLVRGLLEACGTICFRESSASVGISFVHEDERLLETLRSLLGGASLSIPTEKLAASSSGGWWFGLADGADTEAFARWVYAGSEASGLYSTERRRKLRRSVERATGGDVGSLSFTEQ